MAEAEEPAPQESPEVHRSWRPSAAKGKRSARKVKLAIGLMALAGFCGLLFWISRLSSPPQLVFVGLANEDYGDLLPLNPGSEQDVTALEEVFEQWRLAGSTLVDGFSKSSLDDLISNIGNAADENQRLIVYCSFHAHVLVDQDQPELTLMLGGKSIGFRTLLEGLARSDAQSVLLLVDIARLPVVWEQGVLARDVVDQLKEEFRHPSLKGRLSRIRVLCSTQDRQTSWSLPEPDPNDEPEWTRAGTVFGDAVQTGLRGDADVNQDERLRIGELFSHIEAKCRPWNQSVHWIPRPPDEDYVVLIGKIEPPEEPAPPAAEEDEETDGDVAAKSEDKEATAAQVEKELWALWTKRDQLWLDGPTGSPQGRGGGRAMAMPLTWREINRRLLRAEEVVRLGLHVTNAGTRKRVLSNLTELRGLFAKLEPAPHSGMAPSVRWQKIPADAEADKEPPKVMAALTEAVAAKAEPGGKAPAPKEELLKTDTARLRFADHLIGTLLKADPAQFGKVLAGCKAALDHLALPNSRPWWSRERWPAELLFVDQLAGAPVSDAARRQLLLTRLNAEKFGSLPENGLLRPQIFELALPEIRKSLRCALAAERWAMAGVHDQDTRDWLEASADSLTRAETNAQTVSDLLLTRDWLVCELPDHAMTMAGLLEDADANFNRTLEAVEAPAGSLGRLFDLVKEIDEFLAESSEGFNRRRAAQLTETARKELAAVDAAFSRRYSNSGTPWPGIAHLLRNPWIRSDVRKALVGRFRRRKPGPQTSPNRSGRWQAYWCSRVLRLAFVDDVELAGQIPELNSIMTRAEAGQALEKKWQKLTRELESESPERAMRLVRRKPDGAVAEEMIARAAGQRREQLREILLRNWLARGKSYAGLPNRLEIGHPMRRMRVDPESDLAQPDDVSCDENGVAQVRLNWSRADGNAPATLGAIVKGAGVRSSETAGSHIIPVDNNSPVSLSLVGPGGRRATVALVEDDGFPLDIHSCMVSPAFTAAGWDLAIVVPESDPVKTLNRLQSADGWHASPGTGGGTKTVFSELELNPSGAQPTSVTIKRPAGSTVEAVTVGFYQVQEIAPGSRTYRLVECSVAGKPVVASAKFGSAGTAMVVVPKPPPATATFNVTHGLVLRVRPESGDGSFDVLVTPRLRHARSFVRPPRCTLNSLDNRLELVVATADEKAVELSAELGQGLRRFCRKPRPTITATSARFIFPLTKGWNESIPDEGYEVTLSVAGIPHAYRWRVTDITVPIQEQQRLIRIATPDDGHPVGKKSDKEKTIPVRVEVNSPANRFAGRSETVELRLRFPDGGDNKLKSWSGVVGTPETVTLAFAPDGKLIFQALMQDLKFDLPIDLFASNGRYKIEATMSAGDGVDVTHEVGLVFDETAPDVQVRRQPGYYADEGTCGIHFTARDQQSGLVTAVVVFESEAGVKKEFSVSSRLKPGQTEYKLRVPVPFRKPGDYRVTVRVTNAALLTGTGTTRLTIPAPPSGKP